MLLKAAERGEAAKVLKSYLSKNPRDANAWWLMAHAVTKPDNIQTCLERVLTINPEHAKARAKLDELLGPLDEEPDDSFFGVSSAGPEGQVTAPTTPPPTGPHLFLPTPLSDGMTTEPEPPFEAAPLEHDPFAGVAPESNPFTAMPPGPNPFTADIAEADQPPPSAADSPFTAPEAPSTGSASAWAFSFTDDEAPSTLAAPAQQGPPAQDPPASSGDAQSSLMGGGQDAGWFSQLEGADFENPFAPAPSKPALDLPDMGNRGADASDGNMPAWLAGFDANDLNASLASTTASDRFVATSAWSTPEAASSPPDAPSTWPAGPVPGNPFSAVPDWTVTPVGGTPPALSQASPDPVLPVPDPFAPSAPATLAPEMADPFAGVGGPDDPFADLPPDSSFSFDSSIGALGSQATGAKTPDALPEDVNKRVRRVLMITLLAVVVVLAAGGLWVVADQQGVFDPPPPPMTRLDAASFTVEYPEKWDMRCTTESLGYPVCGIANDKLYNQVDYFAGHDVDFAQMFADLGNGLLFGASDVPDTQISVVIMDVTRSSPAYEGYSQAKSAYEMAQQDIRFSDEAKVTYDQHEMVIDGRTANYFHLDARDPGAYNTKAFGREAIYDVYIEHDSRVTVSMSGPLKTDLPTDVIQTMIESIRIKPSGQ